MNQNPHQPLRDVVIREITTRMADDRRTFFLSADFGAPSLDDLIRLFPSRFINVGIAEQNAINIATGLALEGHMVFVYGIAPFVSMRCIEQIRTHFSLLGRFRPITVCIIGVGAGYSYDLSGPTHQTLEDVSMMRALPGVAVLNPCDAETALACVRLAMAGNGPSYLRLDGKPQPDKVGAGCIAPANGFRRLKPGRDAAILATGCMTHVALAARDSLAADGIHVSVFDMFDLSTFDERRLASALRPFGLVATCEEGFVGRGGLDSIALHALATDRSGARFMAFGVQNAYTFENLTRDRLQALAGLSAANVASRIRRVLQGRKRSPK